jgi:hypothetical protein
VIEAAKIAELGFLSNDFKADSEEVTVFFQFVQFFFIEDLKVVILLLYSFKDSAGITNKGRQDKELTVSKASSFLALSALLQMLC